MPSLRILVFTALAMLAFAANSLLCRLALKETAIDPGSFTTLRLLSGAAVLWLIASVRAAPAGAASAAARAGAATGAAQPAPSKTSGTWLSALALFAYAVTFSYAYVSLSAATGALILFGAVQATMFAVALWRGERLRPLQTAGLAVALAGLTGLLLPGLEAPPLAAALLMVTAGVAWGVYSLRGKGSGDPTAATAGNFLRTVPFALLLTLAALPWLQWDAEGAAYALVSGALASGVGYAIWYAALPGLRASSAATVQLSVPVIAAAGGVLLLNEMLTLRLLLAGAAILGGIAMVILSKPAAG